jgi:hypothetical protein
MVAFLEAHGVSLAGYLSLPPKAGMSAVRAGLEKAICGVDAPAAPFAIAPPFRIVRSVGELQQIGDLFENCLSRLRGSYALFDFLDGSVVYIACDEPEMLAAVSRAGPNLWYIEQAKGRMNLALLKEHEHQLYAALTAAGLRLVDQEPCSAWSLLPHWQDCAEVTNAMENENGVGEAALADLRGHLAVSRAKVVSYCVAGSNPRRSAFNAANARTMTFSSSTVWIGCPSVSGYQPGTSAMISTPSPVLKTCGRTSRCKIC